MITTEPFETFIRSLGIDGDIYKGILRKAWEARDEEVEKLKSENESLREALFDTNQQLIILEKRLEG